MKKHGDKPRSVIRDLFLATLNREPTERELNTVVKELAYPALPYSPQRAKASAEDTRRWPDHKYQDVLWALLNSNEFLLNH